MVLGGRGSRAGLAREEKATCLQGVSLRPCAIQWPDDINTRAELCYRQASKEDSGFEEEEEWNDLIVALEKLIEQGPDEYRKDLGEEAQLLQEVATAHHELVNLNPQREEHLLDWSIASKLAGNMEDCVVAHKRRMDLCKRYKTTDAVKLLGLSSEGNTIEELPSRGLFEQCTDTNEEFRHSALARDFGHDVRAIFGVQHDYTLPTCTAILATCTDDSVRYGRIFRVKSFFYHFHDLDTHPTAMNGDEVLAWLFLFGLALPLEAVQDAIGKESVQYLLEGGLICTSPACPSDVVAQVQVYTIAANDLFQDGDVTNDGQCYWFMTD